MKKSKLKKMSYKELGAQLKAVRSLLYYYQRGKNFPGICKLCRVSREYHPRTSNTSACPNCLWLIIEGLSCAEFAINKFGNIDYVRAHTGQNRWHVLRIPMLRRWGRIIQAERDCRTEGGGP